MKTWWRWVAGLGNRGDHRARAEKSSAPGAQGTGKSGDLGAQKITGTIVPENGVGGMEFGSQGELGGDSLAGLRLCHTSRNDPGHLNGWIRTYADDEIKPFFQPGLEQQRHFHHPFGLGHGGHARPPEGPDSRVNNALPPSPLLDVGKNDLGHPSTV